MSEVSLVWDLRLQNKIELQLAYKVVMDMGSFPGQNLGRPCHQGALLIQVLV